MCWLTVKISLIEFSKLSLGKALKNFWQNTKCNGYVKEFPEGISEWTPEETSDEISETIFGKIFEGITRKISKEINGRFFRGILGAIS